MTIPEVAETGQVGKSGSPPRLLTRVPTHDLDVPTGLAEGTLGLFVPLLSTGEFLGPPISVVLRLQDVNRAGMPETSMYQDGDRIT